MMADDKKRGLGRGLGALLPSAAPAPARPAPQASAADKTFFHVDVSDIYPGPEQPRRRFAETALAELAKSIAVHGIIMPLIVRPRPAGGYFLIAGERRWRASQRAGLAKVPVVVQSVDSQEAFERALVENLQRSDLNAIEEASAYQRLADEFGLTQEQIAERVGKERSTVANSLRLLRLPQPVREMVEEDLLTMGHARALLALPDAAAMERAAKQVIAKGLSVRATEALSRQTPPPKPEAQKKSASIRDLEERLGKALGGPVAIHEDKPGGAGRLEIRYMGLDHLDRLLAKLL